MKALDPYRQMFIRLWGDYGRVAFGLFLIAALVRLQFLLDARSVSSLVRPPYGLDEDLYWRAALNLWRLAPEQINFELLCCTAPLHVYWLAGLHTVFDENLFAVRLFHGLLGSLRFALLYLAIAGYFRQKWMPAIAVGLVAVSPSIVVLDASLMKSVNDMNLVAAIIATGLLAIRWRGRHALGLAVVLALLVSLAFLNQQSTLLYFLPIAALFVGLPMPLTRRIGCILLVAGAAVSTSATYGRFTQGTPSSKYSMIQHAGLNAYLGVHPEADIEYVEIPGVGPYPYFHAFYSRMQASVDEGRTLTFSESNAVYRERAVEAVRTDPGRITALFIRRAGALLNTGEWKGIHYIRFLKQRILLLNYLPPGYGFLVCLGLFGMGALLLRRHWIEVVYMGGLLSVMLCTGVLIFVFERYKLPLYFAFALLAVPGGNALFRIAKEARVHPLKAVAATTVLVGLCVWVFKPMPSQYVKRSLQQSVAMERNNRENQRRIEDYLSGSESLSVIDEVRVADMGLEFSKAYYRSRELTDSPQLPNDLVTVLIRYDLMMGSAESYTVLQGHMPNAVSQTIRSGLIEVERRYLQLLLSEQDTNY